MSRKSENQDREASVLFVCRAKELCPLEVVLALNPRFYLRRCHAEKQKLIALPPVLSVMPWQGSIDIAVASRFEVVGQRDGR
jgi:hypothetical protein